MATSNISNTILDLSGSAVSDVVVVARLKPGPGFRIYEGTEVASQITTTSASSGAWSLTLEQNEPADPVDATKLGISPSGSYYEIEEQIPDAKGGLKSWTVTVGTTSQTLYAALVTTLPADVGPTYLTQSSGDARYSQLGNIGSTSTTAVAATASQGTASSAARSDHIHNLGSIVDSSTVELSSGLIQVKDSGITTAKIADSGITTAKINNGAVTTLKTDISFATTAARDAAITSPVEGMVCFLNTGDRTEGLYTYTAGAWREARVPVPGFHAYNTATQSIPTSTFTQITFSTESYDHGSIFASNTFTVPAGYAGKWLLIAEVDFAANAAGQYKIVAITKQTVAGTPSLTDRIVQQEYNGAAGFANISGNCSIVANAAVGDLYKVGVYQDSGGALNALTGSPATFFQATWLGG